jgi:hypothetical protein
MRNAYKTLVGKPERKRPMHGWEDNTKMDLREIGFVGVDSIQLAQDRDLWWVLVNMVTNMRFQVLTASMKMTVFRDVALL